MRLSAFGRGRILVCYSLLIVATACAPSARAVDPFAAPSPDREPGEERIVFTIDNRDYRDATVNAWWDGLRTRVGSVGGNSTQTFRVRWRGDRLYFELDFIAFIDETINVRFVNEHVVATFSFDKTIALSSVEPFYGTLFHIF